MISRRTADPAVVVHDEMAPMPTRGIVETPAAWPGFRVGLERSRQLMTIEPAALPA
jgi:hypothetical protein